MDDRLDHMPLVVVLAGIFAVFMLPGMIAIKFERSGRSISRRNFALIFIVISVVFYLLTSLPDSYLTENTYLAIGWYMVVANLVLIVFAVRRFRGAGWSKWLAFFGTIPVLNLFVYLLLCVIPSRKKLDANT